MPAVTNITNPFNFSTTSSMPMMGSEGSLNSRKVSCVKVRAAHAPVKSKGWVSSAFKTIAIAIYTLFASIGKSISKGFMKLKAFAQVTPKKVTLNGLSTTGISTIPANKGNSTSTPGVMVDPKSAGEPTFKTKVLITQTNNMIGQYDSLVGKPDVSAGDFTDFQKTVEHIKGAAGNELVLLKGKQETLAINTLTTSMKADDANWEAIRLTNAELLRGLSDQMKKAHALTEAITASTAGAEVHNSVTKPQLQTETFNTQQEEIAKTVGQIGVNIEKALVDINAIIDNPKRMEELKKQLNELSAFFDKVKKDGFTAAIEANDKKKIEKATKLYDDLASSLLLVKLQLDLVKFEVVRNNLQVTAMSEGLSLAQKTEELLAKIKGANDAIPTLLKGDNEIEEAAISTFRENLEILKKEFAILSQAAEEFKTASAAGKEKLVDYQKTQNGDHPLISELNKLTIRDKALSDHVKTAINDQHKQVGQEVKKLLDGLNDKVTKNAQNFAKISDGIDSLDIFAKGTSCAISLKAKYTNLQKEMVGLKAEWRAVITDKTQEAQQSEHKTKHSNFVGKYDKLSPQAEVLYQTLEAFKAKLAQKSSPEVSKAMGEFSSVFDEIKNFALNKIPTDTGRLGYAILHKQGIPLHMTWNSWVSYALTLTTYPEYVTKPDFSKKVVAGTNGAGTNS